jgi:hypothetical protein
MAKITIPIDCGNAPKMQLLKDINIAFAENNNEFILENIADEIQWKRIGDSVLEGKDNFTNVLNELKNFKTKELIVNTIITHGDTGAVEGKMIMEDGSIIAFCDIYKFNGHSKTAKIKEMVSYAVEIKE